MCFMKMKLTKPNEPSEGVILHSAKGLLALANQKRDPKLTFESAVI